MSARITAILLTSLAALLSAVFCASALPQSRINGRLVKADGRPLPYTEIELVPIESDKQVNDGRLLAISTTSGRFAFVNVPDGRYTLSINFDEKPTELSPYDTHFYPDTPNRDEAEVFDLSGAKKFGPLLFRLPPRLELREIRGRVVWDNGKPVADAYVYLNDVKFSEEFSLTGVRTDSNGVFKVAAFEGRDYVAGAVVFDKVGDTILEVAGPVLAISQTEVFTLDSATGEIVITLEEPESMKILRERSVGLYKRRTPPGGPAALPAAEKRDGGVS